MNYKIYPIYSLRNFIIGFSRQFFNLLNSLRKNETKTCFELIKNQLIFDWLIFKNTWSQCVETILSTLKNWIHHITESVSVQDLS